MKNYLAYKEQIQGFDEVSEAVRTEEKIAASAIASLRAKMTGLDMYRAHVKGMLDRLASFEFGTEGRDVKRPAEKRAIVVLTADKGLTGGLWRRMVDEFLKADSSRAYRTLITVGAKGEKYLKEEKKPVEKSFKNPEDALAYVSDAFRESRFSGVDILYPKFISLLEHQPVIVPFLPFTFRSDAMGSGDHPSSKGSAPGFPLFDPLWTGPAIFDVLLAKYQSSYFLKIALEGRLAEHAARTMSMDRADTKTRGIVKGLSLQYRKERRRSLTQKQLESFVAHKII